MEKLENVSHWQGLDSIGCNFCIPNTFLSISLICNFTTPLMYKEKLKKGPSFSVSSLTRKKKMNEENDFLSSLFLKNTLQKRALSKILLITKNPNKCSLI